jgi:hypothetical protein
MHYACIAIGDADFLPDEQLYISAETPQELAEIVAANAPNGKDCSRKFIRIRTNFMPMNSVCRARVKITIRNGCALLAARRRRVLDVIGMTQEEFERESAE